jgi:plastocyanin
MRPLLRSALVLLLASGCVDFGYAVDPLSPGDLPLETAEPSAGGEGGADGGCVEEVTAPSETGPQVKFITLNVDTPQLRVSSGDVVTWTNTDTMAHSVNAGAPGAETPTASGGFSSPDLPPNGKWAYRFCRKRTAFYFCGKHEKQMNGYRIIVQ